MPQMWYKEELAPLTFLDSLFPLLRDFLGKVSVAICTIATLGVLLLYGDISAG